AAVTTTAASADDGRCLVAPGATSTRTPTATPAKTPVSRVRAPLARATGVREALPETGKPPSAPTARLLAPRATISRLSRGRSPSTTARAWVSTPVSAKVTMATPAAAGNSVTTSPQWRPPRAGPGKPPGNGP